MTHAFDIDHELPRNPAQVLAAMSDPATWRRVEPEARVTVERPDTGGVVIDALTPLPPESVPQAVRSALPASPMLQQHYVITERPSGLGSELKATIPGAPVDVEATFGLLPSGAGSRLRARISVTCTVPIFGTMVERATEAPLRAAIVKQIEKLSAE